MEIISLHLTRHTYKEFYRRFYTKLIVKKYKENHETEYNRASEYLSKKMSNLTDDIIQQVKNPKRGADTTRNLDI